MNRSEIWIRRWEALAGKREMVARSSELLAEVSETQAKTPPRSGRARSALARARGAEGEAGATTSARPSRSPAATSTQSEVAKRSSGLFRRGPRRVDAYTSGERSGDAGEGKGGPRARQTSRKAVVATRRRHPRPGRPPRGASVQKRIAAQARAEIARR